MMPVIVRMIIRLWLCWLIKGHSVKSVCSGARPFGTVNEDVMIDKLMDLV